MHRKIDVQQAGANEAMTSVTRLGVFCTLGNFLKPVATINLPKSFSFLDNFCKGVKIYHFSSEIIFGQLLQTFGDFSGHTGDDSIELDHIFNTPKLL